MDDGGHVGLTWRPGAQRRGIKGSQICHPVARPVQRAATPAVVHASHGRWTPLAADAARPDARRRGVALLWPLATPLGRRLRPYTSRVDRTTVEAPTKPRPWPVLGGRACRGSLRPRGHVCGCWEGAAGPGRARGGSATVNWSADRPRPTASRRRGLNVAAVVAVAPVARPPRPSRAATGVATLEAAATAVGCPTGNVLPHPVWF